MPDASTLLLFVGASLRADGSADEGLTACRRVSAERSAPARAAGRWPRPRRSTPGRPRPRTGGRRCPSSSAAAAKSAVRSPSSNQTKLPCGSGTSQPASRSPALHPGPLGDQRVHPLEQRGLGVERGDGRGLGDPGDTERQRHRAQRGGDRLLRHGVPDPEAGQPVGLGEGPEQHDVRVGAVRRDAVDLVVHPHELDVRLVDDDEHVLGHPRQERVEVGLGHRRPGRVVGRADHDAAGARPDRGDHRVEVVPAVRGHRHRHRGRGRRRDRDRVGLEGAPGVHHLVAGLAEGGRAAGRSAPPTRSPRRGHRPAPAAARPARRTAPCCPCRGSGSSRRRRDARPRRRPAAAGRGSRSTRACTTSSRAAPSAACRRRRRGSPRRWGEAGERSPGQPRRCPGRGAQRHAARSWNVPID